MSLLTRLAHAACSSLLVGWMVGFLSLSSYKGKLEFAVEQSEDPAPSSAVTLLCFFKYQLLSFRQIALLPEPLFHRLSQSIERNAGADFNHPISDRKGIVKNRIVGEIAHRKIVKPFQRTRLALGWGSVA